MNVECLLLRSDFGERTVGQVFLGNHFAGYSCEKKDRHAEVNPAATDCAIPRGYYALVEQGGSPTLRDVPGYGHVPLLWGKVFDAPEGAIFLGATKTTTGVKDGKEVAEKLIKHIRHNESLGHHCWMTVR